MCRDGYRAKCDGDGCTNTVTCREWPHLCRDCEDKEFVEVVFEEGPLPPLT